MVLVGFRCFSKANASVEEQAAAHHGHATDAGGARPLDVEHLRGHGRRL